MDNKKMGNFIRQERIRQNMTQKELAEKLSVTAKAVSRWECGRGYPDVSILLNLAAALQVSLEELLHGERTVQKPSEPTISNVKAEQMLDTLKNVSDKGRINALPEKADKGFWNRPFIKIFILIPVGIAILLILIWVLSMSVNVEFQMGYEIETTVSLLIIWLIFSTVTSFLPFTLCYIWYKLSEHKRKEEI